RLERVCLRAHFSEQRESVDTPSWTTALLHRIRHKLAGFDGRRVHHVSAGGRDVHAPAEAVRARADGGCGQVMSEVVLEEVVKSYGDVVAVDHVSFTIEDGEFIALVGPS